MLAGTPTNVWSYTTTVTWLDDIPPAEAVIVAIPPVNPAVTNPVPSTPAIAVSVLAYVTVGLLTVLLSAA